MTGVLSVVTAAPHSVVTVWHLHSIFPCVWIQANPLKTGYVLTSVCFKMKCKWQEMYEEPRTGTSLVVHWLRICLPMHGTQVQCLAWEDFTRHRATKPMCGDCWSLHALEPVLCNWRNYQFRNLGRTKTTVPKGDSNENLIALIEAQKDSEQRHQRLLKVRLK